MPREFSLADVITVIRTKKAQRSLEQVAAEIGVSFQYLARVISGERGPNEDILKWAGFRKRTKEWYERI